MNKVDQSIERTAVVVNLFNRIELVCLQGCRSLHSCKTPCKTPPSTVCACVLAVVSDVGEPSPPALFIHRLPSLCLPPPLLRARLLTTLHARSFLHHYQSMIDGRVARLDFRVALIDFSSLSNH